MPGYKGPYMNIKDVEELGLIPEVAPTVNREIMVPDDGIYLGQNGKTADEMNFVGTGETIPATNWYGMPAGYTMVTNPYSPVSPDKAASRNQQIADAGIYMSAADRDFLSDDEFAQMIQLKLDYAAGDETANEKANALRMKNGYYGGEDGRLYNGVMVNTSGLDKEQYDQYVSGQEWVNGLNQQLGGVNSANIGQYVSQYQQQIDALSAAILGRGKFSYDKDTDPLYQQYKESYTRGGQRGMQDTLAQVAARTGGIASSYATSAAQQTYNNYMAELANKVPELQQLAYSMYMDDLNSQRADLSMLMGLEQDAFNRFANERDFSYGVSRDQVADSQWQQNFAYQQAMDALAQQNWQSQFDYNAGRDQIADSQWQQNFAYNAAMDALAQQNWQSQFDYGKELDALNQQNYLNELAQAQEEADYNRQLALAKLLASAGDFSGYKALGLTDAQIAGLSDAYYADLYTGSGNGGGGGNGVWDTISGMTNEAEVYDYLTRNGATATEAKNWIGYWQDLQGDNWRQQVDAGTADIKNTSGNYKAVDEHMRSLLRGDEENEPMDPGEAYKFLEEAYQDGLLTREEFEKLKAKYQV